MCVCVLYVCIKFMVLMNIHVYSQHPGHEKIISNIDCGIKKNGKRDRQKNKWGKKEFFFTLSFLWNESYLFGKVPNGCLVKIPAYCFSVSARVSSTTSTKLCVSVDEFSCDDMYNTLVHTHTHMYIDIYTMTLKYL